MQRFWDATAVALSGLCMVHCLCLPLMVGLMPLLGVLAHAEWVHWAFLGLAAPAAVIAIGPVFHTRPIPWAIPLLALIGIALLLLGALEFPSHDTEAGVTVAGGLMLSAGHILNWRRAHRGHTHYGMRRAPLRDVEEMV